MSSPPTPARWRRRPLAVLLALAAIVVTLAVATALRPIPLTEVLLLVLVEVLAVSLVAGRAVAAATAVGAVLAVNWLLVPPYGTLAMDSQENWLTLAVFLLLAVGASSLVEAVLISERQTATARAREAALAEALAPGEASAASALGVLRNALQLECAALTDGASNVLVTTVANSAAVPRVAPVLTVDVAPGLQVRGWGEEVLGSRPDYVTALATAVVRAWESEELVAEQERSARLAELDAARSALLASIGHDLRTPLSGIRVSADALAMSGDDQSPDDRAELLDGLRQSAIRLDALLGAVLDAARIEAGVAAVEPQDVDLRHVVRQATADFGTERIHVDLPHDPVRVVADPVLLERIVANVLANALAHTPDDRSVELTCGNEPDGGRVWVIDHGEGLAGESADVGRNPHGMGLVIVDRLARFAGIEVARSETPGGGLTVSIGIGTGENGTKA